jgi:hypothetical protein
VPWYVKTPNAAGQSIVIFSTWWGFSAAGQYSIPVWNPPYLMFMLGIFLYFLANVWEGSWHKQNGTSPSHLCVFVGMSQALLCLVVGGSLLYNSIKADSISFTLVLPAFVLWLIATITVWKLSDQTCTRPRFDPTSN